MGRPVVGWATDLMDLGRSHTHIFGDVSEKYWAGDTFTSLCYLRLVTNGKSTRAGLECQLRRIILSEAKNLLVTEFLWPGKDPKRVR